MKILLLTTEVCNTYLKGYTSHFIAQGIINNGIKLYSNSSLGILESDNVIDESEIVNVGKSVDLIIIFILTLGMHNSNTHNNNTILIKMVEINRPEITVYIDYFEYSWNNYNVETCNWLNIYIEPTKDYYRSNPFIYTFLKNYCKKYFKRECYRDLLNIGCIPIQLYSPDKHFKIDDINIEKDIDVLCSFPQKGTGLRKNVIEICKQLKNEGYNVLIADNIHPIDEYYKTIKRSYIVIDAKGAGYQNLRFLEIIKNKSLCFREKYEILFPNDFTDDMIVQYSSTEELYVKIKEYLLDKYRIMTMIENSYNHYLNFHTPEKIAMYIINKSLEN